jgi:D-3-phosphoglycerate dehydrogenase/C-terminal binding protein
LIEFPETERKQEETRMSAAQPLVMIIDSERGGYVGQPDVEQATLGPEVVVEVVRVRENDDSWVRRLVDADAVISWHQIPLDRRALADLRCCRGIVRAAVGYDNIDLAYAHERNIPVCNVPDYGTEEVADHTLALLLATVRKLETLRRHVATGGWDWKAAGPILRLRGACLGIVGLGRIGTAVAQRARAFGLEIVFHDPYVASGVEKALGLSRAATLPELLRRAQFLTLHTPLNEETRHLIGAAELALLPEGAILINTARGEIIDQRALLAGLAAGRPAYAALDVLADEPRVPAELTSLPNVLLTAHSAFFADAALTELRRKAAGTAGRLLRGESVPTIVNGVKSSASVRS